MRVFINKLFCRVGAHYFIFQMTIILYFPIIQIENKYLNLLQNVRLQQRKTYFQIYLIGNQRTIGLATTPKEL